MADEIKRKRVTLHPLKKDGTLDLYTNLYPKCLVDGIVDREGNPINVVVSNEPGISIEQIVSQLEAEIIEHGGITPEDLEEALKGYATIEVVNPLVEDIDDLTTHVGQIDIQLNNKQDFPPIEGEGEGEELYFRIPEPIFSADILRSTLEGLDPEFVEKLIGDPEIIEPHQYIDNFGEVWKFESTDNGADIILIVGDIKYTTSVAFETDTDTEAGGSYVVVDEITVSNVIDTNTLNSALVNKQDTIADLDTIRSGAAAGAAAVSQDDFNNAIGDVEDRLDELSDIVVPHHYMWFGYDQKDERPVLTDWTEGLLTSGYDWQPILLSINGNLDEIWHINSWTSNNNISIELYNEISYIEIHGNVNTDPNQWELDLSSYFAPLSSDNDFYPGIAIINGEKIRDNVLEVNWVTNFRNRLNALAFISVPAKLYTSKDDMDGEPVTIYATHGESPDSPITVHIRTSNGEYKLFYTYEEDPL